MNILNEKFLRTNYKEDRLLGGVIGGLARYFNMDANVLRIATIMLGVLLPDVIVITYLMAVLIVPVTFEEKRKEVKVSNAKAPIKKNSVQSGYNNVTKKETEQKEVIMEDLPKINTPEEIEASNDNSMESSEMLISNELELTDEIEITDESLPIEENLNEVPYLRKNSDAEVNETPKEKIPYKSITVENKDGFFVEEEQ